MAGGFRGWSWRLATVLALTAPRGACCCQPRPCPAHPGRTWCPNDPTPTQCDQPSSPKHCPPGPCPAPPPSPDRAARTYLALDDRNVLDAGGAELVLGPVTKEASDLIAEVEPWEMRFDNMQPNVWYDETQSTWRAWYSTFSSCKFDNLTHYPGPGHNASIPLQCQAQQSQCNLTAPKPAPKPPPPPATLDADKLPIAKGRNGLFLYAESKELTPIKPFVKPSLGLWPWPPESTNTSNNIFLNLGDCAGGGCGTGITMDLESPTANYSRFKWFGSGEFLVVSHERPS